ncbi:MAG: PAS domain S-box protein [Thermodesulfovibrionia bacterium]|nr:PAS domain S-box protein [Thermodesulfovibrionia bacterium]
MKLRIIISTIAFLAFFSISLGMIIFFNSLRDKTYDEAGSRSEELVNNIADDIDLHISEYTGILGFISRQEEFKKALTSNDADTLSIANQELDRLCSIIETMDVCYLMDVKGNTIASSNRNAPDSFLGKNYSFRPYFKQAASGVPAVYAALGVTSNKRGLYYAYPVYGDKDERPSGVIVIKENIEHLRTVIVKPYEGVMMMTCPNDVIFFSNREDWLYKTLWKVTPGQILAIKESRQFGEGPWEWSGVQRTEEHHAVDTVGTEYHIHQKELRNMPGWQIVYLHEHERVIGGIGGALLKKTGFLFLAITIFFGILILYLLRTASLDLSLRKKAAEELKKSEEQFRMLFDSAVDGIFILGMQGNFLDVNRTAHERLGYTKDEMLSLNIRELDPPEFAVHVPKRLEQIRKQDYAIFESAHCRKDKSIMPVEVNSRVIDYKGQQVFFSVIRDITERKKAEAERNHLNRAILLERNFSQAALDSLPGLFYLFDEQGRFIRWNKNFEKVSGYSAEEISVMSPLDLFDDTGKKVIAEKIGQVFQTGEATAEADFLSKDRISIPYFFTGKRFVFDRKFCLVGMGIDISDRKTAEEELHKSLLLLAETGKVGKVGGWELDVTTLDLSWADEVNRIHEADMTYQPTVSEAINFYAPSSRPIIEQALQRAIEHGKPFDLELEIITAKGNHRWVHAIGQADQKLDGSKKVFGICQDITGRKKAEKELDSLNGQLKERNKELQQIVYTVSHDLRSPIINIRGYSRMLVDYLQKVISAYAQESVTKEAREEAVLLVDKDIPEAVSYIDASISKMDSLLSAMLKLSRSSSAELQIEKLDMDRIVSDVLNTFNFQMQEIGAVVEISPLPSCSGDAVQINQLFSNLIGNAVKYYSPERPLVINISGTKDNGQVIYCVQDNGIGIPSDEQGRIFDIFYRGYTEGSTGEGIGLAIVSKIIERHGGKVWVESEEGRGSRFYVQLKCANAA